MCLPDCSHGPCRLDLTTTLSHVSTLYNQQGRFQNTCETVLHFKSVMNRILSIPTSSSSPILLTLYPCQPRPLPQLLSRPMPVPCPWAHPSLFRRFQCELLTKNSTDMTDIKAAPIPRSILTMGLSLLSLVTLLLISEPITRGPATEIWSGSLACSYKVLSSESNATTTACAKTVLCPK